MPQDQLRFDSNSSFTRTASALPVVLAALAAFGCSTTNEVIERNHYQIADAGTQPSPGPGEPEVITVHVPWPVAGGGSGGAPETGGSSSSSGAGAGGANADAGLGGTSTDAGLEPVFAGAPLPNTPSADLDVDVFGQIANRYWFVVSDEQLALMNQRYGGGGPIGPFEYLEDAALFNDWGDIYVPGGPAGGDGDATFVDHLLVTPAGSENTADFGKVQVGLVGESTGRAWTESSLPNLKIDADEFTDGNLIAGVKHMRFNNGVVGSIFREKMAFDTYRRLGYPAPRATYAWVSSSVWGADVAVPYIAVESYKPKFCKGREDQLGGGCENMWEFPADLSYADFSYPENCQFSECDGARAYDMQDALNSAPYGEGFKASLEEWFDWDSVHQFQCLSWILTTGDDAVHGGNNTVLVERTDGKFMYLPYSIDISFGQEWYSEVSLAGGTTLFNGCAEDAACWADLITTCEGLLQDFTEADPVGMLDDVYASLEAEGMLRNGDEGRYEQMSNYIERRLEELPEELELNRDGPYYPNYCEYPYIQCGGYCELPEYCYLCNDDDPDADGGLGQAGGFAQGGGMAMLPIGQGGMGAPNAPVAPIVIGEPDRGLGGAGVEAPDASAGGSGGAPNGCLQNINLYQGGVAR